MCPPDAPSLGWFHTEGDTLILSIYAQPGARQTLIQGLHADALKIRVAAPPLDGRANDEIRRFLANVLQVPLRDVRIISGEKSRSKRFSICGAQIDPLLRLMTKV